MDENSEPLDYLYYSSEEDPAAKEPYYRNLPPPWIAPFDLTQLNLLPNEVLKPSLASLDDFVTTAATEDETAKETNVAVENAALKAPTLPSTVEEDNQLLQLDV